jgi:hypothetical protein
MWGERRLVLAAGAGLALIAASGISDFVSGSFWERHSFLGSLTANLSWWAERTAGLAIEEPVPPVADVG